MSLINDILSLPPGGKLKIKTDELKLFIEIKEEPGKGFTWEVINILDLSAPPLYPKYDKEDRLFFKTEKFAKRNLIRRFLDKNFIFGEIEEGKKVCDQCEKSKESKFFHKNSQVCRVCYYSLRAEIARLEEKGKSKCTQCGKVGEFSLFRKNKSTTRVGVSPICLECQNKKHKEWKKINKFRKKDY